MTAEELRLAFEGRFDRSPQAIVRAPGRVNLIGEHTDTSDGFVLPMAIDLEVRVALRRRDDGQVHLRALDLGEEDAFPADAPSVRDGWRAYPHGVAWALAEDGYDLTGFDAVFAGEVPHGAGLSSSAALELAIARAFATAGDLPWDRRRMAQACRRAENGWVGVASGIMDQLTSACGEEDAALLIDCRSLEVRPVPLPRDTAVVILDTGTRRGLVGSAYNDRRAQVDAAARAFGVEALRDVDVAMFEARAERLDPVLRRRARHVVLENARVLQAAEAMRSGDATRLGSLMNDSHVSLRDDFEVSSEALDAITHAARRQEGCYGARMTGAGFAGCGVALVDASSLAVFLPEVEEAYEEATGHSAALYVCRARPGAGPLE